MSAVKISELDERNCRIVQQRVGAFLQQNGPQVGDYVRFADGVERRISHVWAADWHDDGIASVQTSDGGSFYLGDGYCSFSGALYTSVKVDTLKLTDVCRRGSCWFFDRDHHTAHNGVDVELPIFSEWTSNVEAPR